MSLDRWLELLRARGVDLNAREVLDAAWLAMHMAAGEDPGPRHADEPPPETGPEPEPDPARRPPPAAPAPPPKVAISSGPPPRPRPRPKPPEESEHPSHGDPGGAEAVRVELFAYPRAIERPREFVRALRPFRRYVDAGGEVDVDEERTVERIAHERIWSPVLRPASGRWLDVAFVVDASVSMRVWRPLARELHDLFLQVPFRDVRLWYLHESDRGVLISASATPGTQSHDPAALIDMTGRRLTLVLTDGCGPMWRDGTAGAALRKWADAGPSAILQPLPEELWDRTALAPVPGLLHSPVPAQANRSLEFEALSGERLAGTPVPVIRPEGPWLAPWARLVTGSLDHGLICAVTMAGGRPPAKIPRPPQQDAATRVALFRQGASAHAYRLAGYLSYTEPLDLGLMWLVQRSMFREADPLPMAEVLLSGLLRRQGETETFVFRPGVRSVLQSALPAAEAQRVRAAVSAEIGRRTAGIGRKQRFWAMVAPGSGGEPWTLREAFADLESAGLLPPWIRPAQPDLSGADVPALRRLWDEALRTRRPGDPRRYGTAVSLAVALLARARQDDDRGALDDCAALLSRARGEAELAGRDRLDMIDGLLGWAALTRFRWDHDPLTLTEAMLTFADATEGRQSRRRDMCGLAIATVERARWTGEPADPALLLRCEDALRAPSPHDPARPLMTGTLARVRLVLHPVRKRAGERERAIDLLRQAVSVAQDDDPDMLACRTDLGAHLLAEFRRGGRVEALAEAAEQLRLAQRFCLAGEPLLAWIWAGLGRVHLEEFRLRRTSSSLEQGEEALRRALDRLGRLPLPRDHHLTCDVLNDLGEVRLERFAIERRPGIADDARVLLLRARDRDDSRSASIDESLSRLLIARYESFHDVHDLWGAADHLQRLTESDAEPPVRLRAARTWAGCEVSAGRWQRASAAYDQAIGLCGQIGRTADEDLSTLCSEAAAVELERGDATGALRLAQAGLRRLTDRHRSPLPGLPAARGPMIVINVCERRTDALVLQAGGIEVLPLSGVSADDVNRHARDLLTATRRPDWADDEPIADTLSWLWQLVGEPVLAHLGWLSRPPASQRRRLWWSAAGALSFLPLHAASDGKRTMFDHVISSYLADTRDTPRPAAALSVRTADLSRTDPYEPARSKVRFEGTWHQVPELASSPGRLAVLPRHEVLAGLGEPADGTAPLPAHLLAAFREVVAVMWPVPDEVRLALQDVSSQAGERSTAWHVHDVALGLRRRFPAQPRIWAALRHFGA
ncbi:SAV_2336 N-terminal domain-related protein [Nonomuraea sp. NPDC050153]|uniref:SAV_2336 N-terminal domain-related protein n=1 Tax=Nonomuraea sp. NPDC050153 TaxID=3364359 RepID=UPI003794FCBE